MKTILRLHRLSIRFDTGINDWGGSMLSLVIRFFVGCQFLKAGMAKAGDWGNTLALFRDEYRVPLLPPDLAAVLATAGELTLPVLLFVGLLSRPVALALFFLNLMAVISYPQLFSFDCPAAINDHFYWGALLLVVVAFGAGRFSLDNIFEKNA